MEVEERREVGKEKTARGEVEEKRQIEKAGRGRRKKGKRRSE